MNNFAARLQAAMGSLSGKDLAEKVGHSQSTIHRYTSGESIPRGDHLLVIADVLGVEVRWLLTGEGPQAQLTVDPQKGATGKPPRRFADPYLDELAVKLEKVYTFGGKIERAALRGTLDELLEKMEKDGLIRDPVRDVTPQKKKRPPG